MLGDEREEGRSDGDARPLRVSASLMRMALALLDGAGEGLAAARLRHALEALGRRVAAAPTTAGSGEPSSGDDLSSLGDV